MVAILDLEVEVFVQAEVHAGTPHIVRGSRVGISPEFVPFQVQFTPVGERNTHGSIRRTFGMFLLCNLKNLKRGSMLYQVN